MLLLEFFGKAVELIDMLIVDVFISKYGIVLLFSILLADTHME